MKNMTLDQERGGMYKRIVTMKMIEIDQSVCLMNAPTTFQMSISSKKIQANFHTH